MAVVARGFSVLEGHDRIALANDTADLDPAIEAGAVEQCGVDRPPQELLEILARKIQPAAREHRRADLEALAHEMAQRHAKRREAAAMIRGHNFHLLAPSPSIPPANPPS